VFADAQARVGHSGIGPQGYDPLIGQWHPEAGARPQLRLDFMLFCGPDLFAPVPDATTRCHFRTVSTMIF